MTRSDEGVAKLLANGVALFLAYVLPRVFTLTSIVLAARWLGSEDFGVYGTAAAFAVVLSIFCTLGMAPLLVREIARDGAEAPSLVRGAHVVRSVTGAGMILLLLLLARVLRYPADVRAAAVLLGIGYWIGSYVENLAAYFQGIERMRVCTEASAVFGIVTGVAGSLLVFSTRSPVWFAGAPVLGQLASLSWYLVRAPRSVRRGVAAGRAVIGRLVRDGVPFAAAFVALTIHYKLDVLLMERVRSVSEVGLYTAAYKAVDVFHALVLVMVSATFPRLARAARERRDGPWAATRMTELVILGTVPVAALLWLLRAPLVVGLFGAAYGDAVPALALLAPALPALAVNLHGGYVLGAAGRTGAMAWLYAGSATVKAVLVLVASSRWGIAGAAGAVFVAETLLAGGMLLALDRVAGSAPRRRPVLLGAVAAVATPVVAVGIGAPWAALAYTVVVGGVYGLGGAISAVERRALRLALTPGAGAGLAVGERP